MFITGLTPEQLHEAARRAGVSLKPARAPGGVLVRLDSSLPINLRPWVQRSIHSGRVTGVCWHGFYAFGAAVFSLEPMATMHTALAVWNSREQFEATVSATPNWNTGSYCECGWLEQRAMRQGTWYDWRETDR